MNIFITPRESSLGSSAATSLLSVPLTEFHLFEKLPNELRLKIWTLALPEARIVEIIFTVKDDPNEKSKFLSRTPTPAILHACPDSRIVGLKFYNRLMVTGSFLRTYVRWDLDTIFIDHSWRDATREYEALKGGDSDFNRNCQKVALLPYDCCSFYVYEFIFRTHFPNIKEFMLLEEPETPRDETLMLRRSSELPIPTFDHDIRLSRPGLDMPAVKKSFMLHEFR